MMARLVRKNKGHSLFCYRRVPYQTAINPNVPSRSKSPRLGIDSCRLPEQFVGNFRKSTTEFLEQVQDHPSTLLLSAPARKYLLRWPIQEAHMANICALP